MRSFVRRHLGVFLAALLLITLTAHTCSLLLGYGRAQAVVGMPATPMSYAGVARRTTRRTARRAAWTGGYPAGTVTALPPGCPPAGGACGGGTYTPYYAGSTVVYQQQ
jgi:hypothetical protein